ncbi:MAG: hypothetical protein ACR2P4_07710 [Gammaproteobacteria bacterium]
MSLAALNIDKMRKAVREAYRHGRKTMEELRRDANSLVPRKLGHYDVNAVAFVAADGGNRPVGEEGEGFNPDMVEMVRVVDSLGRERFLDAVAAHQTTAELVRQARDSEPLQVLCRDLGVTNIGELTPLEGKDPRQMVKTYREIAEWAVIYHLIVKKEWGSDTVLVREGPLRSLHFRQEIFTRLDGQFRAAFDKRKDEGVTVSLVGISKSSAILSRLSVALTLEKTFEKDYACYAQVPQSTAEKFYAKRWLDTLATAPANGKYQSMAQMYLVKFGSEPLSPVWAVDIAEWQKKDAAKVLGQLAADARPGFPIPDFPMSVQKAHDHARIGPLENSRLSDILLEEMSEAFSADERERLYRLKYLGEDITARRYRNA